jgi:predicted nucleic acid-binding protein
MKVVSNSTPVIALSRINELELLHILFGTIIIPTAVYNEVVLEGAGRPGVKEVANAPWVIKMEVKNLLAVSMLQMDLDRGEAEAVVLRSKRKLIYIANVIRWQPFVRSCAPGPVYLRARGFSFNLLVPGILC